MQANEEGDHTKGVLTTQGGHRIGENVGGEGGQSLKCVVFHRTVYSNKVLCIAHAFSK